MSSRKRLPRPSATLGENETTPPPVDQRPKQPQCLGRRTYSEVVVETYNLKSMFRNDEIEKDTTANTVQPSTSKSSVRMSDTLNFFSGNPLVEKTTGILHFYKDKSPVEVLRDNCWTLSTQSIAETKVIRDGLPNQYYVLIKFKSSESAFDFYSEFNGVAFNAFESATCNLLFVERIETTTEEAGGSLPVDGLTELPMCAVCLERMDDGVLTILCNHSFHAECLQHWEDTTCPVCRFNQIPELLPDQTCSECGKTADLWMCLICGNIGCGRYAEAHAYRHFENTSHTFTLQLGGNLVWDYAGDNYVHRLIQSSTDGKMVEFQGAEENKDNEKMNAIQLEYSCLLSSQLEDQRLYFEDRVRTMETSFQTFRQKLEEQVETLKQTVDRKSKELEDVKTHLDKVLGEKTMLEKKYAKASQVISKFQHELGEERQMSQLIRSDKEMLLAKTVELERIRKEEVNALEQQVNDLMLHFEFQTKINEANVTADELQDSNVVVNDTQKPGASKKHRKKR